MNNTNELNLADKMKLSSDQLLRKWYSTLEQLKTLKAQEKFLRDAIQEMFFAEAQVGRTRISLGDGYDLLCEKKTNTTVDKAALESLMVEIDKVGGAGTTHTIFRFKPELNAVEFKKLPENSKIKELVQDCLVVKPAAPTISIVKSKK